VFSQEEESAILKSFLENIYRLLLKTIRCVAPMGHRGVTPRFRFGQQPI
jgi:hypothetical protein